MNMTKLSVLTTRNLWEWLNIVWNRVDKQRIQEVGADRACAEWLMRNGAFVKWNDSSAFETDYNTLPPEEEKHFIKEIDGNESSINYMGFPYFVGCNHIERVRFHKCTYLDDSAMEKMVYLKNSLQHLHISSNGNITDNGVKSLGILSKLKSLELLDLPGVTNINGCVKSLESNLPGCTVNFQ